MLSGIWWPSCLGQGINPLTTGYISFKMQFHYIILFPIIVVFLYEMVQYHDFYSALEMLMAWCFSTRTSEAAVLSAHVYAFPTVYGLKCKIMAHKYIDIWTVKCCYKIVALIIALRQNINQMLDPQNLTGELWGVFCWYFWENWPCYKDTTLYLFCCGFVVLCFVVVMQSFIMNSHEVFIHIHQGCFAGTGAIVRLPQCQWSKLDGYGKISQFITTTKHSKAKTACIFLGIYCNIHSFLLGMSAVPSWSLSTHHYKICEYLMGCIFSNLVMINMSKYSPCYITICSSC